ncbi:N-acetyltransferase [Sandaracinobacter sp. RS1-74]|uniref:GNAT family N-acetyltransferase n=1 Tax=Sandaracinobacteroides sayramensis TaxID=2913411 RepID=UPI001EDBE906|nr:N-acetyltransferase [Sandaracinobacteroides sayramensis]MCG2841516.1 N-acetyltransferase [Sandaracinobacteroides sayramensis]
MDTPVDFLSHDSVDPQAVTGLLDLCFGPARMKRTASLLRAGAPRIEAASFVATQSDALVGSVECWEVEWRHPQATRRIALLGPLVSHPDRRGEKIGARLMDLALAELDKSRLPVMLIGDQPYYGRWGFSAQHTGEWILPGPVDRDRLLLRTRIGHRLRGPATVGAQGPNTGRESAAA